jgi:hypothetical protein
MQFTQAGGGKVRDYFVCAGMPKQRLSAICGDGQALHPCRFCRLNAVRCIFTNQNVAGLNPQAM